MRDSVYWTIWERAAMGKQLSMVEALMDPNAKLALYLQALYDLSDPGLEEALLDRLSFRRGFGADQPTPDETTNCRFRAAAAAAGVLAAV